MTFQLSLLAFLLLFSGFFSATETAFTSLSMLQVQDMLRHKGQRGARVERLSNRPEILLTTILIGNNLVNIGASALATSITISTFGSGAVGIMTGVLTLVILIFGEVTPKRLAIAHNEFVSLHTARTVIILSYVFRPFIWFISLASSLITGAFDSKQKHRITLDNVLHFVKLAEHMGVLETYKTRMVRSVFRFSDVTVQAIMTHRTQVFSLDKDLQIGEAIREINERGYSRIPVYDDDPEDIVGIVLVKDLMKRVTAGDLGSALKTIMFKPIYVPSSKKVGEMFSQFKREKLNIAIVIDEFGGLGGIVTLEDVIEEILGEIYDEHEEKGREKITNLGKDTYLIIGDTPLYILKDALDLQLTHGKNVQTIGGYLAELLGRIPQKQEVVNTPAGRFVVEQTGHNRIHSVKFYRQPQQQPG